MTWLTSETAAGYAASGARTSVGGRGPTADTPVVAVACTTDRSAEVFAERDAGGEGEPDGGGSDEGTESALDVGVHDDREEALVDRQPRQQGDDAADRDEHRRDT